jgi:hypothetical protein
MYLLINICIFLELHSHFKILTAVEYVLILTRQSEIRKLNYNDKWEW